jgi:2,3-bisphosphoglycerate-independent phosphoglycerate mutase
VAARGNFCTLDSAGKITDRRAGRIPTEESAPLAVRLRQAKVPGYETFVEPVKEHRFVVVFRGPGIHGNVKDTDPQAISVPPLAAEAHQADSKQTATIANQWIDAATKLLAGEKKANGLTLRGFAGRPNLPSYEEVYGLKAAAIAVYPMYKGLARLVGMEIVGRAQTLAEQIDVLEQNWSKFDFFFLHYKYTDSTGEDGNFQAKVSKIEEFDSVLPRVTTLKPKVLIITGDHSTPSYLKMHSWHPVPTLLVSDCCRADGHTTFGENTAMRGGLGLFKAKYLMTLALANAGRLSKYGA